MRYALRTTFALTQGQHDEADSFLRWLYESLPAAATMGCEVAAPQWLGNRYPEPRAVFEVVTQYPNVYAATADRLRIARAVTNNPYQVVKPTFEVLRVYGEAELGRSGAPTRPHTYPC